VRGSGVERCGACGGECCFGPSEDGQALWALRFEHFWISFPACAHLSGRVMQSIDLGSWCVWLGLLLFNHMLNF
jgi:hypothetical protein